MADDLDASKRKLAGPVVRKEGFFRGRGGAELFYQTWSVEGSAPRATFVVTHGISEHSDAYDGFAQAMAARGFTVIGWDLRGHGRSSGKRGYVASFQDYSDDLHELLEFLSGSGRLPGVFLALGHSMGGLVTLRCALERGLSGASGLCLSAPLLGVSLAVPAIKDLAARALNRFWPTITLYNEIRYEDLTRDRARIASYEADPLRHDRVSPPLYFGIFETIAFVEARANDLAGPVLLQVAGRERIVSRPAMEAFFDRLKTQDKKMIVYPESLHEIYNDIEREKAFDDLAAFAAATAEARRADKQAPTEQRGSR